MLVLLFKIWCTCLVLTVVAVILNDFPKKPGLMFDMLTTITLAAFVFVDIVFVFVMMIMAIGI
jgi:hypothetical protein